MKPPATEQQYQAWEKAIDEGDSPYAAAQKAGTTLSRLKDRKYGDPERYHRGMELSRERRAAAVDRRMDSLAERPEPSPALVTAWAKANHDGYRDKTQIEVTGTVEHEHRGIFGIAQLLERANERGILEQIANRLGTGDARPEEPVPASRSLPAGPAGAAES